MLPEQTPSCQLKGESVLRKIPNLKDAEAYCRSQPYRAYKFIRLPLIETIADYVQKGAKTIQLVRDPRGIFMSRLEANGTYDIQRMNLYCKTRLADLIYVRKQYEKANVNFTNNYYLLRYEDLALRPLQQMEKLYEFVDIIPDEWVLNWISKQQNRTMTKISTSRNDQSVTEHIFGTDRENPTFTAQSWRLQIQWPDVEFIQNACAPLLHLLRYKVFQNQSMQKNLDEFVAKPLDLSTLFIQTGERKSQNNDTEQSTP